MQPSEAVSRRRLLSACLAGAVTARAAGPEKSRVVISRDPLLHPTGGVVDSTRLLKVLDHALQSLDDSDSPVAAWKKVVRPGEVVGLKVNCLAGKGASTSPALVEAICERLQQAGIPRKDIVIWDRLDADLENAGYRAESNPNRIRCVGNDSAGYDSGLSVYGAAGSRLSQTLAKSCDAVINLPVLKDHGITGVTLALKNFFGAIHNPNKYHSNAGDPYIADVYMLPPIREKVRLAICDAITAQYEGGPSYMPQWSWRYNGVIVSRDPVALDYTGWQILERKRVEKGMKPFAEMKREPKYIATAADRQHRLGTNDPNRIELIEV
jgi:uncharacterized protein (DUF362 family)